VDVLSTFLEAVTAFYCSTSPLLICLGGVVPINCILDSISGTKRGVAYSYSQVRDTLLLLTSCPFWDIESTEFIDEGIEITHHSILDFDKDTCEDSGMKDWISFLTSAHKMTEEDVITTIKNPGLLAAFEAVRFSDAARKAYKIDHANEGSKIRR
jgi:hypothetical protein